MNTGQTCVAPDYILCDPSIQNQVVEKLKKSVKVGVGPEVRSCQAERWMWALENIGYFFLILKVINIL